MLSKINIESESNNFQNRLKTAITEFSRNPNDSIFNDVLLLIQEAKHLGYDLHLNDSKTKYTPVHFAVTKTTLRNETQMMRILQLLLDNGADINKSSTDQGEFTPLHTAARRGLPNLIEWLLDNGANRNIKDKKHGEPYQTALDYVNHALQVGRDDSSTIARLTQVQSLLNEPSLDFIKASMKEALFPF